MLSKNQIKLITGLQQKKFRQSNLLFVAEGVKVLQELLLSNFVLDHLYVTEDVLSGVPNDKKTLVSNDELKKISSLSTANNCLAVFHIPENQMLAESDIIIALDAIRDPGNLGTIIRLCDWFGIRQVICSNETVDVYNPKVVQATMGSIARVSVTYVDLPKYLSESKIPIYGTFMDGENVYKETLPKQCILVLGNEANGISVEVEKIVNHKLAIPRFGQLQQTESLNVATATAIFLSELKRGSSV